MLSGDWGDLLDFIRVIIVNLRAQLPSKLGARGQKIFLLLLSSYFCFVFNFVVLHYGGLVGVCE